MADAAGPRTCEACGRPLPRRSGPGRRRRYCNATCRSTVRRRRAAEIVSVKNSLTAAARHDNLDVVRTAGPGIAGAELRATSKRLADAVGRLSGGSALDALRAARELSSAAGDALQEAVDAARVVGHSWREIGDVLGTSRQAAFQRFGHPIDPRTGAPMRADVPPGTAERAVAIVASLADGHWEEARNDFNARMREAIDASRLAEAWARTASLIGSYERMGEPFARRAAEHIVVEIPLHFEAGEATVRAVFDADGQVAGLWLRPADI
jgi:Protein of unknown function (DUF3887)